LADEYKKEKDEDFSSKSDSGDFDDIKNLFRDLKEEIREEFRDIREEIEQVKESDAKPGKKARNRKRRYRRSRDAEDWKDWGENIGTSLEKYISSILESVWDSVDQSVGSLFKTSSTTRERRRKHEKVDYYASIPEEELEQFYQRGAELLSALSDQKRLQMLKELEKEPLRQSDLSEKTNIRGGNFKHHITILKDEGLVHQEGVRERYMLTFAGREALKLAEFLYHRAKKPVGVPIIIDEDESDSKYEEE
jgi:DNA-binding transcriptional ArsR family regulator